MDLNSSTRFSDLVRQYRIKAGLTQEEVAERAGLGRRSVQGLERGENAPRRETLRRLVRALALAPPEQARLEAAARSSPRHRTAAADSPLPVVTSTDRRSVPGRGANLPTPLTSFVGRERELADVRELVLAKRLVTLTGPGGIGKTSLALAVAAGMQAQFADGVWLVELAALTDGALVPRAVAQALGVREHPGEPPLTTVGRAVGTTQRLLVLDNCEHLILNCAGVAETLLQMCPRLRVLATSREPLRVGAEAIWRVPALTVPKDDNAPLAELVASEAVCLFVERAWAVRPGFVLSDRNRASVAAICRRLDGIPLAIELAAARMSALSPEQIACHLTDRFRLLTTGSRTALPRHRTLRALIDWSYDLLTPSERVLFQQLAVFAGGFTLDAAEAICGDVGAGSWVPSARRVQSAGTPEGVLELLIGLVDQSLVVVEDRDGEMRYRLAETLRHYAHERLVESGHANALREAHATFFLTLAEEKPTTHWAGDDRRYLDRWEVEQDNLRAALHWFADRGDAARLLRLSSAVGIFWFVRGYMAEGRSWLDQQLGQSEGVSPEVRATALGMAGYLASGRGDLEVAATFTRESIAIWRQVGDRRRLANDLHRLGCTARFRRDDDEARAALEEGLQIHGECGDQVWIAQGLKHLGALAHQRSDLTGARTLLDKALTIARVVGDPRPIGSTLYYLGLVAEDQGDRARARSLYEQSVGFMRLVKDRWHLAFLLDAFASLSVARGQYRRAAVLSGAGTTLRQNIGCIVYPSMQPRVERTLTLARDGLGEEAFAKACADGQAMTLEQATAYAQEGDDD